MALPGPLRTSQKDKNTIVTLVQTFHCNSNIREWYIYKYYWLSKAEHSTMDFQGRKWWNRSVITSVQNSQAAAFEVEITGFIQFSPWLCWTAFNCHPKPSTFQRDLKHHILMMFTLLSPIMKAGYQRLKHSYFSKVEKST